MPVSLIKTALSWDIDVTNKEVECDKLDEFCDLFNLTNLITSPTCFTKTHNSTIDLIIVIRNVKIVWKHGPDLVEL